MASRSRVSQWFFFFFQAEDGIRDLTVTGVQTCALPISPPDAATQTRIGTSEWRRTFPVTRAANQAFRSAPRRRQVVAHSIVSPAPLQAQIGRASCRERV